MSGLWIRVETNAGDNDKVWAFGDALGIDEVTAFGHLVKLWGGVAEHRPDGRLGDVSPRLLARWAGWRGDAEVFASAVHRLFLCDGVLCGWEARQGKLIERAERDRQRKGRAPSAPPAAEPPRNGRGNSAEIPRNGRGNSGATVRNETEQVKSPISAAAASEGSDGAPSLALVRTPRAGPPAPPPDGEAGAKSGKAGDWKYKHLPVVTVDRLYQAWCGQKGGIGYGRFRKALGESGLWTAEGPPYSDGQLEAGLTAAVEICKGEGGFAWRNLTPETWVANLHDWVRLGEMPIVLPDGSGLTERGLRALGPDASARRVS